jgi:hypothetical protein
MLPDCTLQAVRQQQVLWADVCDYISREDFHLSCQAERSEVETSGIEHGAPCGIGQTPRLTCPIRLHCKGATSCCFGKDSHAASLATSASRSFKAAVMIVCPLRVTR